MTLLQRPAAVAACFLLAGAASLVSAQTAPVKPGAKPADKTLGGKATGSGKLMTRDELRTCLKRLEDVNQSGRDIEAQRPGLDREREELKASGETLKTDRLEVERLLAAVREWEGRVRAHAVDIETFNKRSATLTDLPRGEQQKVTDELKLERERLESVRGALSVDEAKLVPAYQTTTKTYNERALARDAKVTDWNARNTASVDAAAKQQEARALWLNECANRPYLEDDEKAIKAGK
jgi:Spy/CpxP family protein refolding chaperone